MISFHTAYPWLNQFDQSYLTSATSAIAAQLAGNFRPFTRDGVARWMQRLTQVSTSFGSDVEIAEAYVVCAYAAYRLNQLREASGYLEAAIPLYGNRQHQVAVTKWLLGCIYWAHASVEDGQAALVLFRDSIQHFQRLQSMYQSDLDRRAAWYRAVLTDMRDTVEAHARSLDQRASLFSEETVEPAGPQAAPTSADDWRPEFDQEEQTGGMHPEMPPQAPIPADMAAPEGPVVSSGAQEFPASDLYSFLFKTFPISDSIPAGGFGPLGYDPNPIGYMQIDRVVIDGCLHRIQPLMRNGNLINLTGYLHSSKHIALLKVKGDSMNRLVKEGEYVLVVLQTEPIDGNIVVAGFVDEETEATLKRYYRRGNQIALEPVSDNPEHQPRIIDANRPGFKILGVVLAALTPVEE